MNGKALKQVNRAHFKTLEKLSVNLALHVSDDDIHDFRVEVKKLRAFLRLLQSRSGKKVKIKLGKAFKSFYHDIGNIRNLTITEEQVYKLSVQNADLLPVKYLQVLKKSRDEQRLAVSAMPVKKIVKKEYRRIVKRLPRNLGKNTARRFLEMKETALAAIITSQTIPDNQLHEVRKILKDIFYTWEYLKGTNLDSLPYYLQTHEMLKELTGRLGTHQDLVTAIQVLQNFFRDSPAFEEEKQVIGSLLQQLVFYKEILKRPILEQLKIAYR